MDFLKSLGAGAVGALGGFMVGGPIGAVAGFGIGVGAAAAGMSGNHSNIGGWGGAIAGGLVGFSIGGPVGMLAGGALGALFGNTVQGAFQQQPQTPPYAQGFPSGGYGGYGMQGGMPGYGNFGGPGMYQNGGYGQGYMGMPFGMGFPQGGYGQQNPQMFGFQGFQGCYQPQQQQCCYPPQNQPPANQGGQLTQPGGTGQPTTYTTSGGYKIEMAGTTVTVTDPSGKHTVQHSGDPHEYVDGKHVKDWDEKTRTMVLGDGTRLTMNATSANGTITDSTIYDGAQEIKYNNQNNQIQGVNFNPYQTQADARHQAAGETAYFGQDQSGALVYKDLFKQAENLSVTPHNRDISVLQQPEAHHRHRQNWWEGARAA